MSTATSSLRSPDSLPAQGSRRFAFLRRNFWALGDQGLISATNFITGVLTARALDRDEFGAFAIIYAVLLMANLVQSGLVTQSHNVIGATLKGRAYRRYTTSTGFAQLLICAIEVAVALPVALVGLAKGWSFAPMLLALPGAIAFWQLQEFFRRVLYTEGRYGGAFINDMLAYGGQALVLAVLYYAKLKHGIAFTGAIALHVLAITSLLGAMLGLWQLRHSLIRSISRLDFWENWRFGKWLVGGELMQWCSSIQMQLWWAAILLGTWASADLRAAQILFGPTRVIAFFLGTVLPIRFAQTLHQSGKEALRGQLGKVLGVLVPAAGAYCALLALFPRPLLHLVYGADYGGADSAHVLMLYSASAFLNYVQMVFAAVLVAGRQTRYMFVGTVCGAAVALVMSPVCIRLLGAPGAIVSMIVTTLVVTLLFAHAYRRFVHGPVRAFEAMRNETTGGMAAIGIAEEAI
jgi:O-antigen/teichoic acid export membrane protein